MPVLCQQRYVDMPPEMSRKGWHVKVFSRLFYHHGIIVDDLGEQVVHFCTHGVQCHSMQRYIGRKRKRTMEDVFVVYIPASEEEANQIVDRARSQIGGRGFSWVFYNCEHFARWSSTGCSRSYQLLDFVAWTIVLVLCLFAVLMLFRKWNKWKRCL